VPVAGRSSRFYVLMAVVAAIIVFVGFSRTFYLNSLFAKRDLPALYILHGIIFSSWILLFIVQSWLVSADRTDIHRRLGLVGALLAAAMIVIGMAIAIRAAHFGFLSPGLPPPLIFFAVPFFDIVVFFILVGSALYYRQTPATHKRLMLLATISILPPAFARFPLGFIARTLPISAFALGDIVLIACVLYDFAVHRRLHRAYLCGGLLLFMSYPLRLLIAGTPAWLAFARWITGS
jgi:hypothetical protein